MSVPVSSQTHFYMWKSPGKAQCRFYGKLMHREGSPRHHVRDRDSGDVFLAVRGLALPRHTAAVSWGGQCAFRGHVHGYVHCTTAPLLGDRWRIFVCFYSSSHSIHPVRLVESDSPNVSSLPLCEETSGSCTNFYGLPGQTVTTPACY